MRAGARVAMALALLAACGQKGAPLAPELVRPNPPANLSAIATPEGVRLTWQRPLTYSGGQRMNDLGGFTIERAAGDGEPPTFTPAGAVTVQDQERFRKERHMEWLDRGATTGARYLYRVSAYTLDGYRSAPAGPVAVRFGTPDKE